MVGIEGVMEESNIESHIEMAKPPVFNGEAGKVGGFIIAYKLYLRMRMREIIVEEQIQWVLFYIQGGLVNVWKENVLEDLEMGEVEFELVGELLLELKKEFGGGDEESVKVAELRRFEQGGRTLYRNSEE